MKDDYSSNSISGFGQLLNGIAFSSLLGKVAPSNDLHLTPRSLCSVDGLTNIYPEHVSIAAIGVLGNSFYVMVRYSLGTISSEDFDINLLCKISYRYVHRDDSSFSAMDGYGRNHRFQIHMLIK